MIVSGVLPFLVWAATAPVVRDYAGPAGVAPPAAPAPSGSPSGPASPQKPDTDVSVDDVFGTGGVPTPETPPASETPPTSGTPPATPEGPKPPGELDMSDVFGGGAPTPTPTPATTDGGAAPTRVKEAPQIKSNAEMKADMVLNPGADRGGPKPTDYFGGKLKARFRILSSVYGDVDRASPRRLSRNENRIEVYLAYTPNKHVQVVADAEPVLMLTSQAQELDDLASQVYMQRFHFESDAAYVALTDLAPGLDIKLGRQIVVWGTGDKFNPTNNINPDDLEDRPLFTEPIANQMAVVDYVPAALHEKLFFQGVYIPLFFPALLPPSAAAGLKDPFAEAPFANQTERDKLSYLQEDYLPKNPKFIPAVSGHVIQPENVFRNGQFAFKVGSNLGVIDFSASYYYGRHDIPLPQQATTTMVHAINEDPPPADGVYFTSAVDLIYPKMQVVGLDFSTQIPFLGNMGLWGEAALFIPKQETLRIDLPPLPGGGLDVTPNDDMDNPEPYIEGLAVKKQPFIKATAGLDYTFGKHVYVQAQYLRGFINEFGAGHIGNYLVGGTDLIFFGRKLVFRMFGLIDFPSNNPKRHYAPTPTGESVKIGGTSGVLAPALLIAPPWGSVNLEIGSFALLGGNKTMFGQSFAGSSLLYVKVIGSF
ncbi:MAG: hypothetical protein JNL82_06335 [Myxococcales bacterium]|nr:hypothetical protein [Myxococcales bacterium]